MAKIGITTSAFYLHYSEIREAQKALQKKLDLQQRGVAMRLNKR